MADIERFEMKFTSEEKSFILERAKAERMSLAEYIRYACMYESVMSGNRKAIKALSGRIAEKITAYVKNEAKTLKGVKIES